MKESHEVLNYDELKQEIEALRTRVADLESAKRTAALDGRASAR